MKYWYNRFHRDAGYGYRLCHKGDFWSPTLCDAVERAVTGIFQNSRMEIHLGQSVQQSGWITAGGRRYYLQYCERSRRRQRRAQYLYR